jgi:hypothetical protein
MIALRQSLTVHAPDSHIYYLCLDDLGYQTAKKLNIPETTILRPEDLNDKELLASRSTRTNPEFASTCKPAFLLFTMKSGIVRSDDLLVFVDPDFYFYKSAQPLFEKVYSLGSITITPHRFPPNRENEQCKKGIYNAGIMFFKNDDSALQCLEEWRKQCIDWCYLRYENGKIGDQGYLSDWPRKYKGVYELRDKGVNLSTWNINNYKITKNKDGGFFVDNEPLICFHFHGLKLYFDRKGCLRAYPITIFHKEIYRLCLEELERAYDKIQTIDSSWRFGTLSQLNLFRIIKQTVSSYFPR